MTGFSVVALPGIYAMSQDLSGTILTVFLIAAIFGSLPGGWLADKTHREVTVLVGCFLIMALALFQQKKVKFIPNYTQCTKPW